MPIRPAGRRWRLYAQHSAQGVRLTRHRVTATLTGVVEPDLVCDVAAVVAELVGNAVRHAVPLRGGVVQVDWRTLEQGGVEVRVTDGGSVHVPRLTEADPEAISGRGLAIVAALATAWGVDRGVSGHAVWAEVGGLGCRSSGVPAPLG